ncbi:MAG: EAL domain-containing protein [Oceanicaulis sp.]
MTGVLAAGAEAAGAVGLVVENGAFVIEGGCSVLGLDPAPVSLDAFAERLAPGDRGVLDRVRSGEACDTRLRLIGADGKVRYARLIGRGEGGAWRGLLVPAGASPEGGIERIDLETALKAAVQTGEVTAFHQPLVDLQTRRLAGFEALARWLRPDGDVMGPDEFLPLAAEQGLTRTLGEAVRTSAARDAAAWRAAGAAQTLFVAANATAGEICAPGFAESLVEMVQAAGLPANRFKLEVNETEVMADPNAAETALKTLKAAGFSLAIDDFGTGYSSLSRLDRFPFDSVKIDQYFIRAALADAAARAIVKSVVSIARSYAMTIVAEGVETEEAAGLCADLGCDFGQGFRFARALRPEDAAEAVRSGIEGRFDPPA